MLSSATNPISQKSKLVIAYRCTVPCYSIGSGSDSFLEYYVPSEEISFSEDRVRRTKELRHTLETEETHRASAVTETFLPKKLIEEIKKVLEQTSDNSMNISWCTFTKTEEYKNLFADPIPKIAIKKGNCIRFQRPTMTFFEKVDKKGNNPLQKALVNYIMEGVLPAQVSLSDMMNRISQLHVIEQQSILKCIQVRLQATNKQLTILRNNESDKLNQHSKQQTNINLISTAMGMTGVLVGSEIIGSSGAGLIFGILVAAATFGYGNYYLAEQHRQLNDEMTVKEKRLSEVVTNLEDIINQQQKIFRFDS